MKFDELIDALAQVNIQLYMEQGKLKYKAAKGALSQELRSEIGLHKEALLKILAEKEETYPLMLLKSEARRDVYSLTDLQSAYWIGEKGIYRDTTPALFVEEYEAEALDTDRLNKAFDKVIERYEVLRTVVTEDGLTRILFDIPPFKIQSFFGEEDPEGCLEKIRKEISVHPDKYLNPVHEWPLFSLVVVKTGSYCTIFLIGRLILADALSWEIIIKDLFEFYSNENVVLPQVLFEFKDYQLSLENQKNHWQFKKARGYWEKRMPLLPGAPELPVRSYSGEASEEEHFVRMEFRVPEKVWNSIKVIGASYGISDNVTVFNAFAHVIARWSRKPHFLINMMYSRRLSIHPNVNKIVGNFSSTFLVEVDLREKEAFCTHGLRLQRQVFNDLENGLFSGIEVIREMRKSTEVTEMPAMPVVFASALAFSDEKFDYQGFARFGWKRTRGYINTPQVWLDHQIIEAGADLIVRWDAKAGLFEDHVINDMFESYRALLLSLENREVWDSFCAISLPSGQQSVRAYVNNTKKEIPALPLHHLFLESSRKYADRPAVISGEKRLSYKELEEEVFKIAHALSELEIEKGDKVGILLNRGADQIAATLAVLVAGGVYVPLDPDLPRDRLEYLIEQSEARFLLLAETGTVSRKRLKTVKIPVDPGTEKATNFPVVSVDDLAYIIFTSGSTGNPKGVMIRHGAACNTVLAVNSLFDINEQDRVLALSNLNFDLSVYDIFGILAAGGGIVIPDKEEMKNPDAWLDSIERNKITLWNSVPAFVEMLMEGTGNHAERLKSLRIMLLSGDWIPLPLFAKVKAINPGIRFISLGGATEVSIWSNYYEIGSVPDHWKSIPYGYPLPNQSYRILNNWQLDCPDWVPGELYIEGAGVAEGYMGDPEKTQKAFSGNAGIRRYKTGDWGRYWPGGIIEFLGREDSQVKIRGYRIELGEVESVVQRHPQVDRCIALVIEKGSVRILGVFVKTLDTAVAQEDLLRFMETRLPEYMVPGKIVFVADIPLSTNGKVDRKSLLKLYDENSATVEAPHYPGSDNEKLVENVWRRLLGTETISIKDSFFDMGGDSILAVRMVNMLEEVTGFRISPNDIISNQTIERLAEIIDKKKRSNKNPTIPIEVQKGNEPIFGIHPIGGGAYCYRTIAAAIKDAYSFWGLQGLDLQSGKQELNIPELAEVYVNEIKRIKQCGPYYILGWSMGGVIGYEIVCQLERMGDMAYLIMIDPWISNLSSTGNKKELTYYFLNDLVNGSIKIEIEDQEDDASSDIIRKGLEFLQKKDKERFEYFDLPFLSRLFNVYWNNFKSLVTYVPPLQKQPLIVFKTEQHDPAHYNYLMPFTESEAGSRIDKDQVRQLPGNHYTIFDSAQLCILESTIRDFFTLKN